MTAHAMAGDEDKSLEAGMNGRVLSASVRWAKKVFKASRLRQGGRVSGVHPAVQDRSKISWV